ncbi:MAG: hypothetical protein ACREJC_20655, partial [Tepidisphaeraceae bacterium]
VGSAGATPGRDWDQPPSADARNPRASVDPEDQERPRRSAPQRVPPPPVAPTGSTDKHLVHDDAPVDPEPVRRPRSYRDLDDIPDDLD